MYMKKKILAALMAGTMLLSGCAGSSDHTQEPAAGGEADAQLRKLTVVLDWYPNALHAFLYQAEQAGYFAEEGLTVDIQPFFSINFA